MLYRTRFESEISSLREYQYDVTVVSPVTRHLAIKRNSIQVKGRKISVHVPVAAATAKVFDVIVYFHGFIHSCGGTVNEFKKRGMEYYWKTCWFKNMLPELDASGRAAILVAPAMHELVGAQGTGAERYDNLDQEGLFDKLIEDVLKNLKVAKDVDKDAKVGNIVLAGHSGGGSPVHDILIAKNKLKPNIKACWGFECLYPPETAWLNWLKSNSLFKFRHFRQEWEKTFKKRAAKLVAASNFVDTTTAECRPHCNLLRMYWKTCLDFMPTQAGSTKSY